MSTLSRRSLLTAAALAPMMNLEAPVTALSTASKPAVFFSPHQDDEILSMGSALVEHVNAGRDTHVVLMGRGDGTVVRTRDMPPLLGYTPTPFHMGSVRDREFRCTVDRLGARAHVGPYEERLPEKGFTVQDCMDLVRAWVARFPGADVKTHSPYGSNPDHRAAGEAVRQLHLNGELPYAPRYYVSPWDRGRMWLPSTRRTIRTMPSGAQHFYRHVDLAQEMWGVGYKSVPRYFDAHAANPSSWWHS